MDFAAQKAEANRLYSLKKYAAAIEAYTEIIGTEAPRQLAGRYSDW